jgi:hypothetical protein
MRPLSKQPLVRKEKHAVLLKIAFLLGQTRFVPSCPVAGKTGD